METTTDLHKVRYWHKKFTWGNPIKWHDIGRYTFLEYEEVMNGIKGKIHFHIYIDGESQSHSEYTLEEAIITAICLKHDGINTRLPYYICKLLNLITEE